MMIKIVLWYSIIQVCYSFIILYPLIFPFPKVTCNKQTQVAKSF